MKAIRLFIVAAVLLVAGVWLLFQKFSGTMNLSLGWPLSSCTFELSGATKGSWVVVGLLLLAGAAVAFLWALISAIAAHMRPPAADLIS